MLANAFFSILLLPFAVATTTQLPKTLSFGLLMTPKFQWLDAVGAIDFINQHNQSYTLPEWADKAHILKWAYISNNLDPVDIGPGPPFYPTHTYTNAPKLDYLIIPGTGPQWALPAGYSKFVHEQFKEVRLLLTVCTGSMVVANTGILDGYRAASNKMTLKQAVDEGWLNRNVSWVGDRRWVKDRKVWSAGGVTAGIDLAAEFVRVHFDADVVKLAKELFEEVPRPDEPDPYAYLLEGYDIGGKK